MSRFLRSFATIAQLPALPASAAGAVAFVDSTGGLYAFDGTSWSPTGGGGGGFSWTDIVVTAAEMLATPGYQLTKFFSPVPSANARFLGGYGIVENAPLSFSPGGLGYLYGYLYDPSLPSTYLANFYIYPDYTGAIPPNVQQNIYVNNGLKGGWSGPYLQLMGNNASWSSLLLSNAVQNGAQLKIRLLTAEAA